MNRKFWRWVLYRWIITSVIVVVIVFVTGTVLFYLDYINHIQRFSVKDIFYILGSYSAMCIFILGLFLYFLRLVFIEPRILNSRKMKYILKDSTTKEKVKYRFCSFLGMFYVAMICSLIIGMFVYFLQSEYLRFFVNGFIVISLCSLIPLVRSKITQWLSFILEKIAVEQ